MNAYQEGKKEVQEFASILGLQYILLLEGINVAWEQYSVSDYPANYWIDRDGKLVDVKIGGTSLEEMEAKLAKLLGN